jgi:hypothetical protein
MMEKILKAFGYVREEDLAEVKEELLATLHCEERLLKRSLALVKEKKDLKRLLTEKEAQYADAVSRWAGLARLWQEEHGGGLVYVKETADGGVQVWDEAVGEDCEPSAVIELKPIEKVVADGGDEECEANEKGGL